MIIFLVLGVVLGGVAVMFVLQNFAPVSVSFLTWQLEGTLALILMLTFLAGILMTLLLLLPRFIRDEWQYRKLKKHVQKLEEEVAKARMPQASVPPIMSNEVI